jgi:aerobic carbon-monoxide dehydrogenase small subunit
MPNKKRSTRKQEGDMDGKVPITLTINGKARTDRVEPRLLLVHYLRDVGGLTGTHLGCETTNCGACTVIVDGRSVKSCTRFAVMADGSEVKTIEGLAEGGELHPIQKAFWDNHGLQCGFCTPGFIMQTYWYLSKNPNPTEQQIRYSLTGNLCRCTGYQNIIKSVKAAAKEMQKQGT